MNKIRIENKKYVLLPEEKYNALQKKAAMKSKADRALTLEEAKAFSKKLINKWAKEK